MDVVAIGALAIGGAMVVSLNLFNVVMSRRDKVGERLERLDHRLARIEDHLGIGGGDATSRFP